MRGLLWFTMGFGAVCGLWAYGLWSSWMVWVLLALLGICLIGQKWVNCRIMLLAVCGCLCAGIWTACYQHFYLSPLLSLDGAEQELSITASDYSLDLNYGTRVDGVLNWNGRRCQIRVYLEEDVSIAPGDTLRGTFQLAATIPGGQEESDYHQSKGIFLLAYAQGQAEQIPANSVGIREFPALLAGKIKDVLGRVMPEDVLPFAKALLLGDSYELSYEADTALKISGIRHIVAVSGLHISVLYGVITLMTRKNRFLTVLLGMPALVLFAALAGFTPSVIRACIMVGLMMLSSLLLREYDSPSSLAFACLLMLLWNPAVITAVSFQLSVSCVAGILLFQQRIKLWLQQRLPWQGRAASLLAGSISVSLSAMSLATPLSALYFGTVSLISPLTNLLTLEVVTAVFVGIGLVCLVSIASVTAASWLGWLLAWPIRYVLAVAKLCAQIPFAVVYTASVYIIAWLVLCYVLLGVFLLGKSRQPRALLLCCTLGLCAALTASWLEPLSSDLRITMLDVGQGQSILLQSRGNHFLVDCGGDRDEETADIISETLLSQGVHRLDGLIVTHYDRDHAGALENLLTRIDTDLLILPDTPDRRQMPEYDGKLLYLWDTTELFFDTGKITVFGPVFHGVSNENSLCVLLESEKCDILITGDRSDFGERMLLRRTMLPDVDILVAGHHGAESSSSPELLAAVQPELVLISVGEHNYYGHPNPKLLQRLYGQGICVRRTDLEGTITIRR